MIDGKGAFGNLIQLNCRLALVMSPAGRCCSDVRVDFLDPDLLGLSAREAVAVAGKCALEPMRNSAHVAGRRRRSSAGWS